MNCRLAFFSILSITFSVAATEVATSQTYVWVGAATNEWKTPANWTPPRLVSTATDSLIFRGSAATITDIPNETLRFVELRDSATINMRGAGRLTVMGELKVGTGSTLNATRLEGGINVAGKKTVDGTMLSVASQKSPARPYVTPFGQAEGGIMRAPQSFQPGFGPLAGQTPAVSARAPKIARISPSNAPIGSTLDLTVSGDDLAAGPIAVSFTDRGVVVDSVRVISNSQLLVTITVTQVATAGDRDMVVTNSHGNVTFAKAFQVLYPAPKITSISPVIGIAGRSSTVAVRGRGFMAGATSVSFGAGIAVNSVSVSSDQTLLAKIAISPAATTGVRNVVISNVPPGGGLTYLANTFSVVHAPTLTSLSPTSAIRGQSCVVHLSGTNFVSGYTTLDLGRTVTVDSMAAVSISELRAYVTVSPGAAPGVRDVSVSNSGSTGAVTLSRGFTILNPVPMLTNIVPGTGARGKVLSAEINGSGFVPGVTTVLPAADMSLVSVTFINTSRIAVSFVVARDATIGLRDVAVTNSGPGGGSAILTGALAVQNPSPIAAGVTPNTASVGQNLSVVLTGSDFVSGVTSVDFGAGISVGSISIDTSGTHIVAPISIASNAAAGPRSVTITNAGPGGGSFTESNALTITNLAPALTSLGTNTAGRGQSLTVTLTGSNFTPGVTTASFGADITVHTLNVLSPTSAAATITVEAAATTGTRSVSVTNPAPGGGSSTLANSFKIVNPAPTVSMMAPASGVRGQTLDLVISGGGYVAGVTSFTLGPDVTINSFSIVSLTQMHVNVSLPYTVSSGARDGTVTNGPPGGGAGLLSAGFTVQNPVPTIANLVPAHANRGSVVDVTVTGSQFITGVTSLSFGSDVIVNKVVVVSPTEIQANIALSALAASGSRTVTVSNASPGGGSATIPAGFSVGNGSATSIEGNLGTIPDQFVLQEAYPNPFNPSTKIRYGVPEDSRVRIVIHNMLGNVVAELVNGERSKGTYELQWHADYLPSGVYLLRMNAESVESAKRFISSRKLIFMK